MSRGVFAAVIAIILAQFLKIPIKQMRTKKWEWGTFFESGGMPSSHSACVTSLATFIGLKLGIRKLDFAIATIFGLIVMYDAQGVRRHAGETSMKVNELEARVEKLEGKDTAELHERKDKQLKEAIGHQPEEVLGGAMLGTLVGWVSFILQKKAR